MKKAGITQQILAERLGCSQSTIARLLRGDIQASDLVPAISRALGIASTVRDVPESPELHQWLAFWRAAYDVLAEDHRGLLIALADALRNAHNA